MTNAALPRRLAVSTNAVAIGNGNDPDSNNAHGGHGELSEYYVRIEGEAVAWSATQRELPLWTHLVALELGKAKLAGEAGTYANCKRNITEGYGAV